MLTSAKSMDSRISDWRASCEARQDRSFRPMMHALWLTLLKRRFRTFLIRMS